MMAGRTTIAVMALGLAAGGCETDSDYLGTTAGRMEYHSVMCPLADCAGRNRPDWTRLTSAPPKVDIYLQHASIVTQEDETGREDVWYARKPGEIMLCRSVEDSSRGSYNAFWRFREKNGEVIVAESYAWQYVTVVANHC